MLTEVTIVAKDEDSTLRKKFLLYHDQGEELTINRDCKRLGNMINDTMQEFGKQCDNIIVKTNTIWE